MKLRDDAELSNDTLSVEEREDAWATVATIKMTFEKGFLVEQGLSPAEEDALFEDTSDVEAKKVFFDKFTFFKIFDVAEPAVSPKDLVKFIKSKYNTEELPDFVYFEVDEREQTLTVGIRFVLLDAAPEDGEYFVINKDIEYLDEEELKSGVLFIYDGRKDNELRDPLCLGNEACAKTDSSGGCSTGFSALLALLGLPLFFYRKK